MIITLAEFPDKTYKEFLKMFDLKNFEFGDHDSMIADGAVDDIWCAYWTVDRFLNIAPTYFHHSDIMLVKVEYFLYVELDNDIFYRQKDILKLAKNKKEARLIINNYNQRSY